MDTTTVVVIAILVIAVAAAAFVVMRGRAAKPAPKPLSTASEDRTFVGIGGPGRMSDATMVGPAVARSDATVVDVRASAAASAPPPVASLAAAPAAPTMAPPAAPPSEAPTVAMNVPREDATAPTIRIPKLRARVTVTKGGSGTHELEAREYVIGRSTHADVVLADPSVSGQHAKLAPHGDAFALSDLGSTNGTSVDGRAVQGEYVLRGGETIGIGDARLRYECLT